MYNILWLLYLYGYYTFIVVCCLVVFISLYTEDSFDLFIETTWTILMIE